MTLPKQLQLWIPQTVSGLIIAIIGYAMAAVTLVAAVYSGMQIGRECGTAGTAMAGQPTHTTGNLWVTSAVITAVFVLFAVLILFLIRRIAKHNHWYTKLIMLLVILVLPWVEFFVAFGYGQYASSVCY